MTLILATLTRRGAVLAVDRRTLSYNRVTQKDTILTEQAEKLLVGKNIAIAVEGHNENSKHTGRDIITAWLDQSYDAEHAVQEQLLRLYEAKFASGRYGGFVAITYANNTASVAFTTTDKGLQFQATTDKGNAKLKFFGSGNQIAGQLVDLVKPPLEALELQEIINFSVFIIQSTHAVMKYRQAEFPSVGHDVMAAVVDQSGSSLITGGNYEIAQ